MRLTFSLLLLVTCMVFAENASPQNARVNLNKQQSSLKEILEEIEQQTDYLFISNRDIDLNRKVSIQVTNKPVRQVLDQLLENSDLEYIMEGINIILSQKKFDRASVRQQSQTITGTVTDQAGEPMPGVNIVEKGTTNGVVTDSDGKYTIRVASSGSVLLFSFVGYIPQEQSVGTLQQINISLKEDNQMIDEVVVTAMGIKRETKTLTYNVQEVKSKEITEVRDASFINSLAGKIAGVTINNSSSGIGGSTRVVMRGTKSLFGNNDALYVVDGIPMPSLKTDQPTDFYEVPDEGDNDGISHLNPDDIESMSVLTGSAAAALYGYKGANGVVLITTKKGTPGKLKVNYSNSTSFLSPFIMPEFQNTYGSLQGDYASWGEKLDQPSSYDPKDFFQTGVNETNTLNFSVGTEKNQTYGSAGAVNARGIIPNNKYTRYNFTIRNTSSLIEDKLTLDLNASYIHISDQNMRAQGQYHNPLMPLYLFPRGDDIDKYKLYERYNADRNFATQYWPYGNMGEGMQNPYWIINREYFNNTRQRYLLGASLKYDIVDWISVTGRVRLDNSNAVSTRKLYASTDKLYASDAGNYLNQKRGTQQIFADAILNIDRTLFTDFRIIANLGASIEDTQFEMSGYEGHLLYANKFTFSNIDRTNTNSSKPSWDEYHDQTQAIFATLQLGYKNFLFLDLTARNDWPSTLAGASESSVFYPSVGLSGVISDMFDLSPAGISFLKARLSYSGVGNPPRRYITKPYYTQDENGIIETSSFPAASWLEPELTKSFEAGINAKFLQGKISLDATYYTSDTYNQLFSYTPGPSTGYRTIYLNAGKVRNYGAEVTLGYKQDFGDLYWSSGLTFTLNRNEIKEMIPPNTTINGVPVSFDEVTVSSALNGAYQMRLTEGGTMGDVYVTGLKVDHNGYIKVSPTTGSIEPDNTPIFAGSTMPDYNAGFRNSFSYKGFDFSFLFDARFGGIVVSATQSYMDGYGVSVASAEARDAGGVKINGGEILPYNYYSVIGGGKTLAPYVYKATNVRLREVALSYTFPASFFNNKIDAITLSVTGRNLWMIYNKAPFDPELTASTGTYYQGFDYFMMPSLRSWGFAVKVAF